MVKIKIIIFLVVLVVIIVGGGIFIFLSKKELPVVTEGVTTTPEIISPETRAEIRLRALPKSNPVALKEGLEALNKDIEAVIEEDRRTQLKTEFLGSLTELHKKCLTADDDLLAGRKDAFDFFLEGDFDEKNPSLVNFRIFQSCLAIKNNNGDLCNLLKERNSEEFIYCQRMYILAEILNLISTKNQNCEEVAEKCANLQDEKYSFVTCQGLCKGLTENDINSCSTIPDEGMNQACRTIVSNDLSLCQNDIEDAQRKCQNLFYLVHSIKENDKALLEKIIPGPKKEYPQSTSAGDYYTFLNFGKFFFGEKEICEEFFSENHDALCNEKYEYYKK